MRNLREYVGIPFRDKGFDPVSGLDCWQLVRLFYRQEFGIALPDYMALYSSSLDMNGASDAIRIGMKDWNHVDTPKYGDVLIFRITSAPWHTGVRLDGGNMLHTDEGHGSVIEPINGIRWRHRLWGAFRWKS